MTTSLGIGLVVAAGCIGAYAYAGYPLLLRMATRGRRPRIASEDPELWPSISIVVAMYNEEEQARGLIESLLALEYPEERRQILVVSDGSTDRTEEIVGGFANRGVELLCLPERGGKTAAENAAASRIRGEIVVNTDASTRISPGALKPLIATFSDSRVGLASGRDVSVSRTDRPANVGESGYVGYEMWVRDLETALRGIVGASGCFYAIRAELHRVPEPPHLSRDFAAALKCEEAGLRAVSVREATCLVPRTTSLKREYRRKVRTFTRGMETLLYRRKLLDPFRDPVYAWMLFSHKVVRWAVPWAAALGAIGLVFLAVQFDWALALLALGLVGLILGGLGWALGDGRRLPKIVEIPAFALAGNVAAIHALIRVLKGQRDAVWEPTRRKGAAA